MIKFTNITLADIRECSSQDIYLHILYVTPPKKNFDMHRSSYSSIFLFSIIAEVIFLDSKNLCIQFCIACFPLVPGHIMIIFKIQNHSEKYLKV